MTIQVPVESEPSRPIDIYYDQNDIIVRRSFISDAEYLGTRLRKSDINEVWASHNYSPVVACDLSIKDSVIALTIEVKGKPVGLFGISSPVFLCQRANIWFLASDDLNNIKIRFIKHSRRFVDMMLNFYPYLDNYVDARNLESIAWLKFIGAKIEEAAPYGIEKLPFHHFSFERI